MFFRSALGTLFESTSGGHKKAETVWDFLSTLFQKLLKTLVSLIFQDRPTPAAATELFLMRTIWQFYGRILDRKDSNSIIIEASIFLTDAFVLTYCFVNTYRLVLNDFQFVATCISTAFSSATKLQFQNVSPYYMFICKFNSLILNSFRL